MQRFIVKRIDKTHRNNKTMVDNNIKEMENNDMNIMENIAQAEELTNKMVNEPQVIKRVKKDKGLMEKTISDKVVLMEDNRQVLND